MMNKQREMNLNGKNVIFVGDDFITPRLNFNQLSPSNKPKSFNIFTQKFADLRISIDLCHHNLRYFEQVDLLLIFPFLWELVYRMDDHRQNVNLLVLKDQMELNLEDIMWEVQNATAKWISAFPNLLVCWCLPYTPDFTRYNTYNNSIMVNRLAKSFYVKGQEMAREFHSRIKELMSFWSLNNPDIVLFDFNECYFLNEHLMENSFLKNNFSQVHFPSVCTTNGLIPSDEFISRFHYIFELKIYPLLNSDNTKKDKVSNDNNEEENMKGNTVAGEVLVPYDQQTAMSEEVSILRSQQTPMSVGPYNQQNEKRPVSHSPVVIDYQHSKPSMDYYKSQMMYKAHPPSPYSDNSNSNSSFSQPGVEYSRSHCDAQAFPPPVQQRFSQEPYDNLYYNRYRHNSPHFAAPVHENAPSATRSEYQASQYNYRGGPSPSVTEIQNSNTRFNTVDQKLSKGSRSNTGISEFLASAGVSTGMPAVSKPELETIQSSEVEMSILEKLGHEALNQHKPEQSVQHDALNTHKPEKGNINNAFSIPEGLLDNVKNALKFLNTTKGSSKDWENERKTSPYAKFLSSVFKSGWTDLFLNGDLNIAVDCVHFCVEGIMKLPSKKGLKVIMMTSSEELVDAVEKSLQSAIDKNLIGVNENIPYGAPVFLIDLPSNLRLRLSQQKFSNLSELSALLVFGDPLLANKTSSNIEFIHLTKSILSKANKEGLCKIVISQSGSTESEVVAQNALRTTFFTPSKDRKKEEEKEVKPKEQQSLSDFLSGAMSNPVSTTTAPTTSTSTPTSTYTKRKSSSKEKSRSPHTKKSAQEELKNSPSPADKLTEIFKFATASISEKELKDYDQHDKDFMTFLQPLGRKIEKEYMLAGRDALQNHEEECQTYKKVPDLHPDFEEKYAMFTEQFENAYGKEYNRQHMQTTWKHFWEVTITNLQEREWKEKKKALQKSFQEKYKKKAAEIEEAKKASSKRNERHKTSTKEDKRKDGKVNRSDDDIVFLGSEPSGSMKPPEKPKEDRLRGLNTSTSEKDKKDDKKRQPYRNSSPESKRRKEISPSKSEVKKDRRSSSEKKAEKDSTKGSAPLFPSVNQDMKRIYLESCSKTPSSSTQGKQSSAPSSEATNRSKISFHINPPKSREEKVKFSLPNALRYLDTIAIKIGVMGPALLAVVNQSKEHLPNNPDKALKVFSDQESELLVNLAISKLKTMLLSCTLSEADMYRVAIPLFQKLLEEAKTALKNTKSKEDPESSRFRVDVFAIAKATTGFDTESTYNFIKNTFLYKGLSDPTTAELNEVFKEVSQYHFKFAMSS